MSTPVATDYSLSWNPPIIDTHPLGLSPDFYAGTVAVSGLDTPQGDGQRTPSRQSGDGAAGVIATSTPRPAIHSDQRQAWGHRTVVGVRTRPYGARGSTDREARPLPWQLRPPTHEAPSSPISSLLRSSSTSSSSSSSSLTGFDHENIFAGLSSRSRRGLSQSLSLRRPAQPAPTHRHRNEPRQQQQLAAASPSRVPTLTTSSSSSSITSLGTSASSSSSSLYAPGEMSRSSSVLSHTSSTATRGRDSVASLSSVSTFSSVKRSFDQAALSAASPPRRLDSLPRPHPPSIVSPTPGPSSSSQVRQSDDGSERRARNLGRGPPSQPTDDPSQYNPPASLLGSTGNGNGNGGGSAESSSSSRHTQSSLRYKRHRTERPTVYDEDEETVNELLGSLEPGSASTSRLETSGAPSPDATPVVQTTFPPALGLGPSAHTACEGHRSTASDDELADESSFDSAESSLHGLGLTTPIAPAHDTQSSSRQRSVRTLLWPSRDDIRPTSSDDLLGTHAWEPSEGSNAASAAAYSYPFDTSAQLDDSLAAAHSTTGTQLADQSPEEALDATIGTTLGGATTDHMLRLTCTGERSDADRPAVSGTDDSDAAGWGSTADVLSRRLDGLRAEIQSTSQQLNRWRHRQDGLQAARRQSRHTSRGHRSVSIDGPYVPEVSRHTPSSAGLSGEARSGDEAPDASHDRLNTVENGSPAMDTRADQSLGDLRSRPAWEDADQMGISPPASLSDGLALSSEGDANAADPATEDLDLEEHVELSDMGLRVSLSPLPFATPNMDLLPAMGQERDTTSSTPRPRRVTRAPSLDSPPERLEMVQNTSYRPPVPARRASVRQSDFDVIPAGGTDRLTSPEHRTPQVPQLPQVRASSPFVMPFAVADAEVQPPLSTAMTGHRSPAPVQTSSPSQSTRDRGAAVISAEMVPQSSVTDRGVSASRINSSQQRTIFPLSVGDHSRLAYRWAALHSAAHQSQQRVNALLEQNARGADRDMRANATDPHVSRRSAHTPMPTAGSVGQRGDPIDTAELHSQERADLSGRSRLSNARSALNGEDPDESPSNRGLRRRTVLVQDDNPRSTSPQSSRSFNTARNPDGLSRRQPALHSASASGQTASSSGVDSSDGTREIGHRESPSLRTRVARNSGSQAQRPLAHADRPPPSASSPQSATGNGIALIEQSQSRRPAPNQVSSGEARGRHDLTGGSPPTASRTRYELLWPVSALDSATDFPIDFPTFDTWNARDLFEETLRQRRERQRRSQEEDHTPQSRTPGTGYDLSFYGGVQHGTTVAASPRERPSTEWISASHRPVEERPSRDNPTLFYSGNDRYGGLLDGFAGFSGHTTSGPTNSTPNSSAAHGSADMSSFLPRRAANALQDQGARLIEASASLRSRLGRLGERRPVSPAGDNRTNSNESSGTDSRSPTLRYTGSPLSWFARPRRLDSSTTIAQDPGNYLEDEAFRSDYDSLWSLGATLGQCRPRVASQRVISRLKKFTFAEVEGKIVQANAVAAAADPIEDQEAQRQRRRDLKGKGRACDDDHVDAKGSQGRSPRRKLAATRASTAGEAQSTATTAASERILLSSLSSMQCPICLSGYQKEEVLCATWCHHGFHRDCLTEWLKSADTCPLCRSRCESNLFSNGSSSSIERASSSSPGTDPASSPGVAFRPQRITATTFASLRADAGSRSTRSTRRSPTTSRQSVVEGVSVDTNVQTEMYSGAADQSWASIAATARDSGRSQGSASRQPDNEAAPPIRPLSPGVSRYITWVNGVPMAVSSDPADPPTPMGWPWLPRPS
ncbi:unnamed protein product [Parajaminaea phylloscopi]